MNTFAFDLNCNTQYQSGAARLATVLATLTKRTFTQDEVLKAFDRWFDISIYQFAAALQRPFARPDWHLVRLGPAARTILRHHDAVTLAPSRELALASVLEDMDGSEIQPADTKFSAEKISFFDGAGIRIASIERAMIEPPNLDARHRVDETLKGIRQHGERARLIKRLSTLPGLKHLLDDDALQSRQPVTLSFEEELKREQEQIERLASLLPPETTEEARRTVRERVERNRRLGTTPRGPLLTTTPDNLASGLRSMLLQELQVTVKQHEAQQLLATLFGARDWNALLVRREEVYRAFVPTAITSITDHEQEIGTDEVTLFETASEALFGFAERFAHTVPPLHAAYRGVDSQVVLLSARERISDFDTWTGSEGGRQIDCYRLPVRWADDEYIELAQTFLNAERSHALPVYLATHEAKSKEQFYATTIGGVRFRGILAGEGPYLCTEDGGIPLGAGSLALVERAHLPGHTPSREADDLTWCIVKHNDRRQPHITLGGFSDSDRDSLREHFGLPNDETFVGREEDFNSSRAFAGLVQWVRENPARAERYKTRQTYLSWYEEVMDELNATRQ